MPQPPSRPTAPPPPSKDSSFNFKRGGDGREPPFKKYQENRLHRQPPLNFPGNILNEKHRGDWSPKKERPPPPGKNYRTQVWEGKGPPPRRRKRPESSSSSASSSSEEDDKNERTRARSGWASLPEMGKKF